MKTKDIKKLVTELPQKITVLVAEDSLYIRKLIVRLLKQYGFTDVVEVENGKQAWEYFQKNKQRICLLILDWIMPEMDGLEVCRLIRNTNVEHYVYIIFLSVIKEKEEIARCLEAGADDYILKPIHAKEFYARITVGLRIIALEKMLQKTNRRLKKLATMDKLTDLFNRRALFRALEKDLYRAIREQKSFHNIMLDIDYFKKVNDTYGHQVGDAVLKELAQRLRNISRPYDVIGRYGGEEFLIGFINGDGKVAVEFAERLRESISQQPFIIGNLRLPITISLGVASFQPAGKINKTKIHELLGELIKKTDDALYEAKRQGRNRVVVDGDTIEV
jgi:two-component system chemotaxis response regulator CheY